MKAELELPLLPDGWQPQIVTAGVLAPGWLVIDLDGTYWHGRCRKPTWNESKLIWDEIIADRLRLKEIPQVTGRDAIWEIK